MTAPTPIPCEGGCGRLLRTPDSIRRRHGPVCWEKANPTRGRGHSLRARRPKPVTPATGQLTLFEETTTMTDPSTPTSLADEVWAECAASVARLNPGMSTRNVLVHGLESFAESWATTWGFSLHDPNDVKELARWLRDHLDGREAKGAVPQGPSGTTGMTTPAEIPPSYQTADATITNDLFDFHNTTHVGKPLTPDCAYCDAIAAAIRGRA